ncbi:MAG: THUMP domain-containing protein [Nanoarchaeota archaeon]|nr:THUMP domain-containing protein [Nanoarchaeota archaeon]
MYNCYAVRYHEIALKGKNRAFFERKLAENIRVCLKRNRVLFDRIRRPRGRIIVHTREDCSALKYVFGISSFSRAVELEADIDKIKDIALHFYTKGSFKVSAQRSDKRFSLSSQQINEDVGRFIIGKTGAKVDLESPDVDIGVEIFDGNAYVFTERTDGLSGLPIGTAGKVAVLLESDKSIVSAFLMLKRGCSVVFVKRKDIDVSVLDKYSYGSKVNVVDEIPFDVKALVANDMMGSVRSYDTKLVVLRPLASFTKEGIGRFLKGL